MLTLQTYKEHSYERTNQEHQTFIVREAAQFSRELEKLRVVDKVAASMCGITACFTTGAAGVITCGFFNWVPNILTTLTDKYMLFSSGGTFGYQINSHLQYQQKLADLINIYHWAIKDGYPTGQDTALEELVKTIGPFIISQKDLFPGNLDFGKVNESLRNIYDEHTYLYFSNLTRFFEKAAQQPNKVQKALVWVDALRVLKRDDYIKILQMHLYGKYTFFDNLLKGNGPWAIDSNTCNCCKFAND